VDLTSLLQGVGGPSAYGLVALLACLESAAFVGLLVPGETVMLVAGVLASFGRVDLVGMVLVASAGAVAGDQIGYAIGRASGPSLRSGRFGRWIGPDRWDAAEDLVARRGGLAVFVARWIGVLRAVVPAAAGAVGVPRPLFLAWNAVGGVLWATTVIGAGFLAGASWPAVQKSLGVGGMIVGGVVSTLVTGVLLWRWRRRAARTRSEDAVSAAT
jgi:membrane-associated protein